MLLDRQIDAVTFTSASTVRNFAKIFGEEQAADLLRATVVASIGPVTAEAAQQLGIRPRSCRSATRFPTWSTRWSSISASQFGTDMTTRTQSDTAPSAARQRHARRTDPAPPAAPAPPHAGDPSARARDAAVARTTSSTRCSSCPGEGQRREVGSMPGVFQLSVDEASRKRPRRKPTASPACCSSACPTARTSSARRRYDPEGPVQTAVRALKQEVPGLLVITDVCLCEYTSHGHCGIVVDDEIVNDATVEQLARAALSHAAAGADIVAPSDMMDGRVGRIREALDDAGFTQTAIMAYAAKYCSAFYGPFREAADSAPAFGDRRSHQMDPANVEEALREVALDLEEGADIVMVKPAVHVPRRHRAREGRVRHADRRVSRQRRVRDAEGRRAQRLDRRAARDDGNADVDPPRRRRHHHHLLRPRGGQGAGVTDIVELIHNSFGGRHAEDHCVLVRSWRSSRSVLMRRRRAISSRAWSRRWRATRSPSRRARSETWEFSKDASTKGAFKVGDKVTVNYKMIATDIDASAAAAPRNRRSRVRPRCTTSSCTTSFRITWNAVPRSGTSISRSRGTRTRAESSSSAARSTIQWTVPSCCFRRFACRRRGVRGSRSLRPQRSRHAVARSK